MYFVPQTYLKYELISQKPKCGFKKTEKESIPFKEKAEQKKKAVFTVGTYLALKITHSARILGKIQYFSHLPFLQPGSQDVNFSFLSYCIFSY